MGRSTSRPRTQPNRRGLTPAPAVTGAPRGSVTDSSAIEPSVDTMNATREVTPSTGTAIVWPPGASGAVAQNIVSAPKDAVMSGAVAPTSAGPRGSGCPPVALATRTYEASSGPQRPGPNARAAP